MSFNDLFTENNMNVKISNKADNKTFITKSAMKRVTN